MGFVEIWKKIRPCAPAPYAPRGAVEGMRYTCQECGDYYLNEKPDVCETCGKDSFDDGVLWTNREYNKARQELILKEMAKPDEARDNKGYITEAERDAAKAQRDETRAAVLAALRRVTDNPDSTNAELLEAAKLAVEVQGRGY